MTLAKKEQSASLPAPAEAIVACIALSQAAKMLQPHIAVMRAYMNDRKAFDAIVAEMPERFPTRLQARKYFLPYFAAGTVFCEVLDEIAAANLRLVETKTPPALAVHRSHVDVGTRLFVCQDIGCLRRGDICIVATDPIFGLVAVAQRDSKTFFHILEDALDHDGEFYERFILAPAETIEAAE